MIVRVFEYSWSRYCGRKLGVRILALSEIRPFTLIGLFEVVIPDMAFKFDANNFNFTKVRLGYVLYQT